MWSFKVTFLIIALHIFHENSVVHLIIWRVLKLIDWNIHFLKKERVVFQEPKNGCLGEAKTVLNKFKLNLLCIDLNFQK